MDVRCEKCQTEYELDEARLKPGGVTVKCTNCGHMFKIRRRTTTNVGAASVPPAERARVPVKTPPRVEPPRGDETLVRPPSDPAAGGDEKQWLIRLENGDQKSCRELATLQQWIVANVVTRESLISRTGKTWKRLGDISELAQYFVIADEARSGKPAAKDAAQQTLMGIGAAVAGGKLLPDEDDNTTGNYRARTGKTTPPPPPHARAGAPSTPPSGSARTRTPPSGAARPRTPSAGVAHGATPRGATASQAGQAGKAPEPARPATTPPPPPRKAPSVAPPGPDARSTGAWAADMRPDALQPGASSGPLGGRIKVASEPAFAGRIRVEPSDDAPFNANVKTFDDDDQVLPERRGSRGGLLLVLLALLVMGAAAGAVYVFVIKKDPEQRVATPAPRDAAVAAVADAGMIVTAPLDATAPPPPSAIETARAELGGDSELRLRDAIKALEGKQEAGVEAMRVHLATAIAQGLLDRATVTADKVAADKLKKEAKQLVLDVAPVAQRAHKATPDDVAANLAMAHVLRLQGKPAADLARYLTAAKAKPAPEWKRDVALAEALTLARDGKLDAALAALVGIDQGPDALEAAGDIRARFQRARILYAQNKPTEARPLVEQVLAAHPDHVTAKALLSRIETTVAKTDPLPPEDPPSGGSAKPPSNPGGNSGGVEPGDSYDRLLAKANAAAERNCTQALDLYGKALEQKPNGVEALTGMGYCHIDAKQFASAFSKFRAALAVSPRYEPALWGVGEAYQQQGRKEQAIEAFKAYLEVYPNAAKATKAIERLGGSTTDTPPPGPGSSDAPKPPDPPPPAPTPTPTPSPTDNGGAGSGSG